MKVAVVGSRAICDYKIISDKLSEYDISVVISGGAKGVDSMARDYAELKGLTVVEIRPDWAKYKRAAGPIRNREIVEASDYVVAFWDGKSKGTLSTIKHAKKMGVPIDVWTVDLVKVNIDSI